MGIYLHFFHGRKNPQQEMQDRGEPGPIFGPYEYAHTTYASDIKLGPTEKDSHDLTIKNGLVYYDGMFYGDWSIHSKDQLSEEEKFFLSAFEAGKAAWPEDANLSELEGFAGNLGIVENDVDSNEAIHDIDDLVHDLKSNEASNINNAGLSSQLKYLLETLGLEQAKKEIGRIAAK